MTRIEQIFQETVRAYAPLVIARLCDADARGTHANVMQCALETTIEQLETFYALSEGVE